GSWAVTAGSHTLEWDLNYDNSLAETNLSNDSASTVFSPTGLDVVAQSAYLLTAAGGGTVVASPALGQTVYFTSAWAISAASGSVTVTNRAMLDGSSFCSGSATFGNGSWISWCNNGWTATAGSHTLRWDFD